MTNIVFLDTETTGLDPFTNEVWEVGFLVYSASYECWLRRLYRVYPDLTVASVDGLRISGFYDRISDMRDPSSDRHAVGDNTYNLVDGFTGDSTKPDLGGYLWSSPKALAAELSRELAGAHVVGAVPWFDAALHGSFLSEFLRKNGQKLACHYHLIDVETLAMGYLAATVKTHEHKASIPDMLRTLRPPWDSDRLSMAVGVDPQQFDRHTALGDALWAKAIYDKVMT